MSKLNSKQMKQTEVKTGVLIHIDTLKNCTEMLQTAEQRAGLLETMLAAYYPNEFKPSTDHWTLSSWKFLEDNIKRNDAKFEQNGEKKRKNWEEWKERNKREKEAKERELAELRNKLQLLQTTAGTSSTSVIEDNPLTVSSTTSSTVSSTTSSSTSSTSDINISISENKNTSFSNKINKYTMSEVQAMLEEREIFFKKDWLQRFYHLNALEFKWKYHPLTAADAYIRIHPESVKGKEGEKQSPPGSAPSPQVKQISEEIAQKLEEDGRTLWASMREEARAAIPAHRSNILNSIYAVEAYKRGYNTWAIRFIMTTGTDCNDIKFLVLTNAKWSEMMAKHHVTYARYISRAEREKERKAA